MGERGLVKLLHAVIADQVIGIIIERAGGN